MTASADTRKRIRSRLEIVQLALFLIAGLAIGWYAGVSAATAVDQQSWLPPPGNQQPSLPPSGNQQSWLPPSGGSGWRTPAVHNASVRRDPLAPRSYIGRVRIDRLGLSAVMREGADERTLRTAAGHLSDTPLPGEAGNSAVAGHRDTLFRKLKDVRVGDRIAVSRPSGTVYFTVRDTRIVSPSDVSVLAPTDRPTLTLVTCYPFRYIGPAPKRFVVRAVEDAASAP